MKIGSFVSAVCLFAFSGCINGQTDSGVGNVQGDTILKIEMNLSAFGVESDDFPSISASIDFQQDTSFCYKSYYNPAIKSSTYVLTKNQKDSILQLLKVSGLEKLKAKYLDDRTDQPRSITKIYTASILFTIDDYGLEGDYPLKELYRIVYGFDFLRSDN